MVNKNPRNCPKCRIPQCKIFIWNSPCHFLDILGNKPNRQKPHQKNTQHYHHHHQQKDNQKIIQKGDENRLWRKKSISLLKSHWGILSQTQNILLIFWALPLTLYTASGKSFQSFHLFLSSPFAFYLDLAEMCIILKKATNIFSLDSIT